MYSIVNFNDAKQFERLEGNWNTLFDANADSTLFNSFEWVKNWKNHYWIRDYTLDITLIYKGDLLVALLPLYKNKSDGITRFLGSGEPEYCEVASEYLDFLIDMSLVLNQDIYEFVASYLETNCDKAIELINCLETSHANRIARLCKNSLQVPSGQRFAIDLARQFEEIFEGFSNNHKKKTRQLLNRFDKSDSLKFEKIQVEDHETHWQILKNLHTENWNSKGKPGAFVDDKFNRFHLGMHEHFPQIEQAFYTLSDSGQVISINHYYLFNDTIYFYATGSNKGYGTLSPGILLHLLCLRLLAGKQLCYDFMKGALTNSYKEKFCKGNALFYSITIFNINNSGKLKYNYIRLRMKISKWIQKLKS